MALFSQILIIVLPVFLVIGLGFLLKRINLVDDGFIRQLNRLVFYVALPALLFYKIASSDFHASFNPSLLFGLAGAIVATFAATYLYGVIRNYPHNRIGAFSQGASRGNLAFVGLAVSFNAFGEEGFAIAGVLVGFIVPLLNLASVLVLLLPQRKNGHSMSAAFWMSQFAFNPLIIASFSGIFWSYFDLPLPSVIDRSLDIVTGMSLPLALIAIGASFSPRRLQGDIRVAGLATLVKIVVQPLVAGVVLFAIGVEGRDLAIGVILAGTPTAAAAFIMAQQLKSDAELSGSIIMLSTAGSLITYTASLLLLSILNL